MGSGRFMTLMLMEFRPSEGVRWVRAGHDPAILYDPLSGEFTEFLGPGMALGVLENAAYQESHAPWPEPGQVLALGTDGIWEARNASGEMFGKERYRDSLKSRAGQGASAILDGVFEDLRAFAGPVLEDDATLMVVKVRPEPPG
jgi:sigma-B regulation protein RsbU (phosphoserine phosphatase)